MAATLLERQRHDRLLYGPALVSQPSPALLADLSARLQQERKHIEYAGTYGSRYGGWAIPGSDLDCIIAYTAAGWSASTERLLDDLVRIAAGHQVELGVSHGRGLFDHEGHPASVATFLVGERLVGDATRATDSAVIALASAAQTRTARAALAAARRAPIIFSPERITGTVRQIGPFILRGTLDDLTGAAGFLRCNGKDRSRPEAQIRALIDSAPASTRPLLRQVAAGTLPDTAGLEVAAALEQVAASLRRQVGTKLGQTL